MLDEACYEGLFDETYYEGWAQELYDQALADEERDKVSELEQHDDGQQCICVADHNPNPMELNRHHIHPLAEGGSDEPDNVVWLCPTSHTNVHELLRAIIKYEGSAPWEIRRHFSPYIREIAEEGYRRLSAWWARNGLG